jgi:hypothetical protein
MIVGSLEPPTGVTYSPTSTTRFFRAAVSAPEGERINSLRDHGAAPTSPPGGVLRQLRLPLRVVWDLTSTGLPWAGPGDLTTHYVIDCISYPTLIRTLRVPPPATGPNRVPRAASRPWELRDNVPRHRRPRDPTGTAGCGRPMELLVGALLPWRIRLY